MPNTNKEELVRILAPLITKNGDVAATAAMLREQTLEKLQWMFDQQPEAARRAVSQARELAASNSELQRDRQELAEARAAALKASEDLQWSKFFQQHPDIVDNVANRIPLETYAISISTNGCITTTNLEEALTVVEKDRHLLRTAPKIPLTPENLKYDRETLQTYCRNHRLAYGGESALGMLRNRFGSGFSNADIAQAAEAEKIIQLRAESDPAVLAEIERDEKLARADYLRNHASPSELRQQARTEFAATAQANAQAEFQESQKISAQSQSGFPPLPQTWNGKLLDAQFIKKADKDTLRAMIRKHGSAAVTARVQGQ